MIDLPAPSQRWTRGHLKTVALVATSGRWTPDRKTALVQAIAAGEISRAEAIDVFGLSYDEIASWQRGVVSHKQLQERR